LYDYDENKKKCQQQIEYGKSDLVDIGIVTAKEAVEWGFEVVCTPHGDPRIPCGFA
jgi:hypothetical protein